jgi:MarR family transcriptional regulator, organic hydroperoxide resistance regulator
MAKGEMRGHAGGSVGKERQQIEPGTDDRFPPLSTSIESFVKDGSDRDFRQLIYSLLSFSALMTRHREYYASYIGVTGPQYSMIALVAETPGATVGDIAEQMRVSSPFITAEINKLIKKNIIEKKPNQADRRSMSLNLTPRGQNLLRELGPIRRESNDQMFGSLTGDRGKMLKETMSRLVQDAENALHALEAPHLRDKKAASARSERPHRPGRGRAA